MSRTSLSVDSSVDSVVKKPCQENKYGHLQLLNSIRPEVEKPFPEKLAHARQLIKLYAHQPSACVSCSFGKDSMAVTFLALEENPKIRIVFSNTGIEFPETLRLKEKVVDSWNMNFVELKPKTTFWKINQRIIKEHLRLDDGRKHSNICCYHLKERPFELWGKDMACSRSFTGITALESRNRMFVACKKGMDYYSVRSGFAKVHPIMFWTAEEVWDFNHDNKLPINETYAKYGIDRVGCMWCMAHKGWREQIQRINPKVYGFMMEKYLGSPLMDKWLEIDS
jgi:phosphoadenosine phosphosulfate reductase